MYDTFSSRLDFVVSKIGGVGKACAAAEITPPTLTRWKDGTSDPKISNLQAFARAGGVSIDWLINGDNEFNDQLIEDKTLSLQENSAYYSFNKDDDTNFIKIPAYNIEVSAGHGIFSDGVMKTDKYLAFRKRWIAARNLKPTNLAVVFTKGDSMEPTIPENAAIVLDMSRNKAADGKIYVIRIDDRLYVKRTQWVPLTGGLRLISDNKHYDSFDITKEDFIANNIEVIGQVIHAAYDLPD